MNQPKNILLDALRISIAGAIIGLALVKGLEEILEETDEKSSTATETLPTDINWATVGRTMLADTSTDGLTLNDHLQRQYLGLFLIGATGECLKNSELESACKNLQHFHQQLDREEDWGLIAWYETIGVSHKITLHQRLRKCPEVVKLNINPSYIAYTLGEKLELQFGNIDTIAVDLQHRGLLT